MRAVLLLALAGCGDGALTQVSDMSSRQADMARAVDMGDMATVSGCLATGGDCLGGILSGHGNTCCAGLCDNFSTTPGYPCVACGTAGLECCTARDGSRFCGPDRTGQRSVCAAVTTTTDQCIVCGGFGQACCGGKVCATGACAADATNQTGSSCR
jgi:hypothetical protein